MRYTPKQKKAPWTKLPGARLFKPQPRKAKVRTWKPIPKVSKAKAKSDREYNAAAREFLRQSENRWCACCETFRYRAVKRASQVHHTRGRLGELKMHKRWWAPLCDTCHDFAHRHIEKARAVILFADDPQRAMPLMCAKGEWDVWKN